MSCSENNDPLLNLLCKKAFRQADQPIFKLSTGIMSSYHIDCKNVSLDAHGAFLIGEAIFERIKSLPIEGVGGMTLGADPIATAVTIISYIKQQPIPAFIVRKERKQHGTCQQVEGAITPGAKLAVVEDVVTTGASTLKTIDILRKEGYTVLKVIALVDRLEGGSEKIIAEGVSFEALYTIKDFTNASQLATS